MLMVPGAGLEIEEMYRVKATHTEITPIFTPTYLSNCQASRNCSRRPALSFTVGHTFAVLFVFSSPTGTMYTMSRSKQTSEKKSIDFDP